jgi:hypothetical protein
VVECSISKGGRTLDVGLWLWYNVFIRQAVEGEPMISLQESIQSILTQPVPEALVSLHGVLLALRQQGEAVDPALETAGRFHAYLSDLQSKISARNYSELASRLDIGAVGAVALENVLGAESERFWQGLFLGGLAEVLMVAASRQYVKGWEVETGLVHTQSVWFLTEALWHVSAEMQPDLDPEQRWHAIQALLAPASDPDVPASDKAVLLGRVFQILLLTHLAGLMPAADPTVGGT